MSSSSPARLPPKAEAVLRTLAALPLAYIGTAAVVAATATLLVWAGVPRSQAAGWPLMASFLVWLVLALYAFAARPLWRAWAVPGGCALAGAVVVWLVDVGGML